MVSFAFTGDTNKIIDMGRYIAGLFLMLFFLCGCIHKNVRTDLDTPVSGTIHVSADESFKPFIDREAQVFEAMYPKTKIEVTYTPEAACFDDLVHDSLTRMILVSR